MCCQLLVQLLHLSVLAHGALWQYRRVGRRGLRHLRHGVDDVDEPLRRRWALVGAIGAIGTASELAAIGTAGYAASRLYELVYLGQEFLLLALQRLQNNLNLIGASLFLYPFSLSFCLPCLHPDQLVIKFSYHLFCLSFQCLNLPMRDQFFGQEVVFARRVAATRPLLLAGKVVLSKIL